MSDQTLALLLVIVCLLAGVLLQWIVSKLPAFPPPISVVWFLFGMVIAITVEKVDLGDLGQAFLSVKYIDSSVVYYILLPILLYEATQNINWHKFKRFSAGGLSLAVGGVGFQVGLLGVLFQFTFMAEIEEEASWFKSFLLASALSSTDPVAVLSVLNSLQAPEKLCSMFDGESLINDGSSVLLFQLFFTLVNGQYESPGQGIFLFVKLLFLGPLFGIALGFVLYAWLHFFRGHHLCQVIGTVTTCYLGFFVAEIYFMLSGPLTVVCYGLFVKAYGHIALDREAQEKHHHFVDGIALICNILIFILAGVISMRMMSARFDGKHAAAWWQVVTIYVYLNGARALMVLSFSPVLRWTGYGVDWKETVLLIWGGLRGALVLALGLRIEESTTISREFGETSTFFISASVFLILLINGVSFEFLYILLNPYPPKPFRRVYLEKVMKMIDYQYMEERNFLQKHWLFTDTDALYYADKIVPNLGWRKLDKRGKLSIRVPNIAEVFTDVSDAAMGKWNRFLSVHGETEEEELAETVNTSPNAVEHSTNERLCSFDPKYNLRLIERATNANEDEPMEFPEAAKDDTNRKSSLPQFLSGAKLPRVIGSAAAQTSDGLGSGRRKSGSSVLKQQESGERPHQQREDCRGPASERSGASWQRREDNLGMMSVSSSNDERGRWNHYDADDLESDGSSDDTFNTGGQRRHESDATLIFDSSMNLHKLLDSTARSHLPFFQRHTDYRTRTATGATVKGVGFQLRPTSSARRLARGGGGGQPTGLPPPLPPPRNYITALTTVVSGVADGGSSSNTSPPTCLEDMWHEEQKSRSACGDSKSFADRRTSTPNTDDDIALLPPKTSAPEHSKKREKPSFYSDRACSESVLATHPHNKVAAEGHKVPRSASFAESAISVVSSSLDYLDIPPTPRRGSRTVSQNRARLNRRRIIRKEREGELYIMMFNACRQMYKTLYETHCIGGSALLSLSTSLDISGDFAIGKLRQNPIKAWKDVLEETPTKVQDIADGLQEVLTGFEFEWRILHTRFHCVHRLWLASVPTRMLKSVLLYAACQSDLEQTIAYVDVHEELMDRGAENMRKLLGRKLTKSYQRQIVSAKRFVFYIRERYPDSFKYVLIRIAATLLLNLKKTLVAEQADKGLLLEEDKEKIMRIFGEQQFRLTRYRPFFSWFRGI